MMIFILVGMMTLTLLIVVVVFSSRFKRVPPNQAMIVFGQKYVDGFFVIQGGGKFIQPIIEEANFLNLEIRTLDIKVPGVITHKGVALDIEAVAQVKIDDEEDILRIAAEQLLGKSMEEIENIARRILEGHARGVCAMLTVEEVNANRNKVAMEIQKDAIHSLLRTGLTVVSFTIRGVEDNVNYLASLGKRQTVRVIKDARIGKAKAQKEELIRAAKAREHELSFEALAICKEGELQEGNAAVIKALSLLKEDLAKGGSSYLGSSRDIFKLLGKEGMSDEELRLVKELTTRETQET